jgi:hypothetical protein
MFFVVHGNNIKYIGQNRSKISVQTQFLNSSSVVPNKKFSVFLIIVCAFFHAQQPCSHFVKELLTFSVVTYHWKLQKSKQENYLCRKISFKKQFKYLILMHFLLNVYVYLDGWNFFVVWKYWLRNRCAL